MKSILDFQKKKQNQQKISMITCYDYTSALIINQTEIDCVLVGDSGGMVMLGKPNTTQTTLNDMEWMTRSVANGLKDKFIVADMPFMSYRQSKDIAIQAVTTLIQAGAQAIKLEGAHGNLQLIEHIVRSGVPVMGHLGLTPQHIHQLGGYKVQGKQQAAADLLIKEAHQLEAAGCFSLVLECVPANLAKTISQQLTIPVIGIGAGVDTDGQVLVWQDLLGLQNSFQPKFVKRYLNGAEIITQSINTYVKEVNATTFPDKSHIYLGESA